MRSANTASASEMAMPAAATAIEKKAVILKEARYAGSAA